MRAESDPVAEDLLALEKAVDARNDKEIRKVLEKLGKKAVDDFNLQFDRFAAAAQ